MNAELDTLAQDTVDYKANSELPMQPLLWHRRDC